MEQPEIIFEHILEIIGYDEDRSEFVKSFFEICRARALGEMVEALPISTKETILAELKAHPESAESLAKQYLDQEEFYRRLEETSAAMFQEYITGLMNHITPEEKAELKTYLANQAALG